MNLWNDYRARRDVKRSLRRLDRVFETVLAERDDPRGQLTLEVRRVRANIRVPLRVRVRVKLSRLMFALRNGRSALNLMDSVTTEVERKFLFGEEHRVQD